MSIPGFAVRHDVDGDAVLHLRHRGHANVWQHCAQSKHRDRETQQLPAHRTSFHDAFQVRKLAPVFDFSLLLCLAKPYVVWQRRRTN